MRCPGQDMRFWKPGDIFNIKCPKCGTTLEFFKDEVKRKCPCGHVMVNPRMNFGCAQWCQYAEQCVGAVPEEAKIKRRAEERDQLKERISLEMKKTFVQDVKRIHHALKVARYAEKLLKAEGGNPLVVLAAAYLHDLGAGEKGESPAARRILEGLEVDREAVEEICGLVGRFDQPGAEETLNFQILHDADRLVRMEERIRSKDREDPEGTAAETFETVTGKALAEELRREASGQL